MARPAGVEPASLMTLGFFPSRPVAEAVLTKPATDQPSLEATAEAMRQVFPAAVAQYVHMGRSIHRVLAEHDAEESEPTRTAKVGRNDPCPCGSGKKYKRCCGATVH